MSDQRLRQGVVRDATSSQVSPPAAQRSTSKPTPASPSFQRGLDMRREQPLAYSVPSASSPFLMEQRFKQQENSSAIQQQQIQSLLQQQCVPQQMPPSGSSRQQQGRSPDFTPERHTSSHFSDDRSTSNTTSAGAGGENQEALFQLQQNLMVMLHQQQLEHSAKIATGNDIGARAQHPQQQQMGQSEDKPNGGAQGGALQNASSATLDSNEMLAQQYHQLFGTSLEGLTSSQLPTWGNGVNQKEPVPSLQGFSGTTGGQNSHLDAGPSSLLFALGTMVQPLYSGNTMEDPSSPYGLKLSDSSSDFMMNLFQSDNKHGKTSPAEENFWNRHESNGNNDGLSDSPPLQLQDGSHGVTNTTIQNLRASHRSGPATEMLKQQLQQEHQEQQHHQQQSVEQVSSAGDFSRQMMQQQQLQQLHQLQQHQNQQERQHLLSHAEVCPNHQLQELQKQHQHEQQKALLLQGVLQQQQLQLPGTEAPEASFMLPSTMLPPSVLASMFPPVPTSIYMGAPAKVGKAHVKPRKRKFKEPPRKGPVPDDSGGSEMTPQSFFRDILVKHGYDPEYRLKADDSGYDAVPSALQLASFGTHLVKAVHTSDSAMLSKLLECGLSPNPCNQFRDSIVDLVCKRANHPIFECLLEHGTDLQVVDGFGRTPLHHACWASTFCRPIVESILERDPIQFFLEDKHGQTPLEYVRHDMAGEWMDFLEEVATKYWPVGGQPPRILSPKDRRPEGHLVDPPEALSLSLASMVSSGAIMPEQIANMEEHIRRTYEQ